MSEAQRQQIDQNYDAFQRMRGALLAEHRHEHVLIRHRELIDFYATAGDAYRDGLRRFDDGLFSIQEVTDEPIDLGFWSHVSGR